MYAVFEGMHVLGPKKIADQLFFGKLQLDLTSQKVFTINYWHNVRSS